MSKYKKRIAKHKSVTDTPKAKKYSFLKNLLLLIATFLFLQLLIKHNKGYKWTHEILIQKNLKNMKKFKNLNHDEKLEAKLGFTVKYLNNIKNNTPEDAIIIMPPDSIISPPEQKSNFNQWATNKFWTNYWVYPRKLIYEKDKNKFPLIYQAATHVAIINHWGYDKLSYQVKNKTQYTVMSINLKK